MDMYVCRIEDFSCRLEEGAALLPPARRERLARLRGTEAQLQCLCAGLLLRRFVGPVETDSRGKPFSPGGPCFNLSHSGPLAVLAVSPLPVGADVEAPGPARLSVAERCFLPEELAWMEEAPEERFAFLWTRKEAVMKCCGLGLALPPRSFCVLPGNRPRAEGMTYSLHTARWDGCTLSAASARQDACFRPVLLGPEDLLP